MKAAAETDLKPTVVRLGQIAHTPDGYWNEREWFPLIIKSAQSIKCLPDLPGVRITLLYDMASKLIITQLLGRFLVLSVRWCKGYHRDALW